MTAQTKRALREQRKRAIEVERERRGDASATRALLAIDGQIDRRATLNVVRQRRAYFAYDHIEARTFNATPRFADSIDVHCAVQEMRRAREAGAR